MADEWMWRDEGFAPSIWINAVRELALGLNVGWHLPAQHFRVLFARHFIQHRDEWTRTTEGRLETLNLLRMPFLSS